MKEVSKRQSNFELLRIIAMIGIIIHHVVIHAVNIQLTNTDSMNLMNNGLFNSPVIYKKLLFVDMLCILGILGNVIFIIISGYFNVSKKDIDMTKTTKKLITQLFFSFMCLFLLSSIYYSVFIKQSYWGIIIYDSSLFNTLSWFIGYYFLIILSGKLFLNKFLNKLTKKQYIEFLVIIIALVSFKYSGELLDNFISNLRIACTGVFLYSLGGFIKKYNPFDKIKTSALFLGLLVILGLIFISAYNTKYVGIRNYEFYGSTDDYIQKISSYQNYNIFIILIGIIVFELFRRIKIGNNKVINYISSSTLMIYLFHDNPFFRGLWNTTDWMTLLYNSPELFILNILRWTAIMFVLGYLVYLLYDILRDLFRRYKHIFLYKK